MSLTFRWLGVAGLEFNCAGYTLLIDPFFTRPGKAAVVAGLRVASREELAARCAPRADAVLVTHAHYDHLLDVPGILRRTGAPVYGSPNTCALLKLQAIPAARITGIHTGDRFELGPFSVEVFPARHTTIPMAHWFNGPLPSDLAVPLRLSDYRMDDCFSFRLSVDGMNLLVGNHPVPADALFISPYHPIHYLKTILHTGQPRVVVPIHWEDFMRPLWRPLRPMLLTPAQGLRPWYRAVGRMDLTAFTHAVHQILPTAEVHVPKLLRRSPLFL